MEITIISTIINYNSTYHSLWYIVKNKYIFCHYLTLHNKLVSFANMLLKITGQGGTPKVVRGNTALRDMGVMSSGREERERNGVEE